MAKLRSAGWQLPPSLGPEYIFRVYDTRLDQHWLRGLLSELHTPDPLYVVGGDFLTQPHLEDSAALNPTQLARWGPRDASTYHIVVPPRPHVAQWLHRAHQQVAMEANDTVFTVCCVVPRNACGTSLDNAAVRRLVPSAAALLDDSTLEVQVLAVGERPPLVRVPAQDDSRRLPPASWEVAHLAMNRVLLLFQFRRMTPQGVRFQARWVRGEPPRPSPSDLELLRVEMVLPPALQQAKAEKAARAGLRQIATALTLPEPPPHQLRQIVVQHGIISGILGVPRGQARDWLRGSGCGGLYLRPFWTESTGEAVARQHFSLLWVRGQLAKGPKLWQALWDKPGVVGLLPSGQDVVVRVTAEADLASLEPQLRFAMEDPQASFRRRVPGQRWWRLGPLTEAEAWYAKELVAKTGLEPIRGELRFAQAGPFRRMVYFSAVGEPTRLSLDDGSWSSSAARLQLTNPPPRSSAAVRPGGARPSPLVRLCPPIPCGVEPGRRRALPLLHRRPLLLSGKPPKRTIVSTNPQPG